LPETIERIKKAKIVKIADWIYSYSKDWKNIMNYKWKDWRVLFWNLQDNRDMPFFNPICSGMWLVEKDNNWVFEIFKLESWISWKQYERKIDKYSLEYFKIWKDIDFYSSHALVEAGKMNKYRIDKVRDMLDIFLENWIKGWYIRIKDLIFFLKPAELKEEKYIKAIKKLWEILPQQCLDIRFDKISDSITSNPKTWKWELEIYLKEGYITKEIYDKCIINLKRKEKEMNEIHSQTKAEVSEIQVG
jgi:hypothetical protein